MYQEIIKSRVFKTTKPELFLRVLKESDVTEKYVSWLNDYNVTKYTELWKEKHKKKDIKDYVKKNFNSKSNLLFGIFFNDSHIGNIKLGSIDFHHETANISYIIGEKKYWGIGITTCIIKKITEIAFKDLKLKKVNAGVYENNIASMMVLKKNKFMQEGRRIKDKIFEKVRVDCIYFGLLNDKYK